MVGCWGRDHRCLGAGWLALDVWLERVDPSGGVQGSPVWQALAGHKRRIPLAVVLPPPARGAGIIFLSREGRDLGVAFQAPPGSQAPFLPTKHPHLSRSPRNPPGSASTDCSVQAAATRVSMSSTVPKGVGRPQSSPPQAARVFLKIYINSSPTKGPGVDRKSTRLNSSHKHRSRMPSSA